ncbi:ABC transporter substrate-binding protein [Proteiniclasticum ruminis]|uniref:Multiple sugar transport system substrate-binding protein n=1 Tax=Proteiniclasticum ruminis TaxID=398199 RepID=A0A1I5BWN7_9CLOT|nr:sugar ABC transporter substrate-binding protein [Proteiniclasticum ruminis]SFN79239.1 multiple sugar transport system substrate-binding protein [Proteiniclasticum ruminis]
MKLKKIVALLSLSALILSACGTKEENPSSGAGDTVKIRFATWDSEESLTLQQELVDKFNSSQEKIQVTLEAYGDEYDTKLAAGMGAKDAPDVMYMWNYPAYKDALEPLDSYIEKEGEEYGENFYEALWNYNKADDMILGLPVGYTTHVMYYNKDLFDAKGVSYPETGWTWEDAKEIAKKLSDEGEDTKGLVFSGKPDPFDFEMYLWSNGSAYVDESGNLSGNLNSKETVEVFTMFQDMLKEGIAVASEGSGTTEMKTGKVGMYVNGSWGISSLKDAGINYGIVELPSFEGKEGVSIVSSSGLSMSKDSKNKEAAFEFMKFWTGETANLDRIEYELPVLKSVVASEKLSEDPEKSVFYTMLEKSEGYTPSSSIVSDWSIMAENLNLVFERIFNPSTLENPQKALDEAAK